MKCVPGCLLWVPSSKHHPRRLKVCMCRGLCAAWKRRSRPRIFQSRVCESGRHCQNSGSRESQRFQRSVVDVCSLRTKLIPAGGVVLGDWLLGHYRVDVLSNTESGNDRCSSGVLMLTVAMELGLFWMTRVHTGLHTCDLGSGLPSIHEVSGPGHKVQGERGKGVLRPQHLHLLQQPHDPRLSYRESLSAETYVHVVRSHTFQVGVADF